MLPVDGAPLKSSGTVSILLLPLLPCFAIRLDQNLNFIAFPDGPLLCRFIHSVENLLHRIIRQGNLVRGQWAACAYDFAMR